MVDAAPARNAPTEAPQMGSQLAAARDKPAKVAQDEEIPVYVYPLDFLRQMAAFYQDPDPEIEKKLAFLTESSG
eukprot:gene10633-29896_t